ncbi:response regulator [Streptomyces violaceorubidus]
MTRVLVIDDEPQIVRALVINLKARHSLDAAHDGATALQLAAARHPDVVVLDLGLPDMDGVDVIRGLRGWTRVPILVLSARHSSDEKVEALDAGADDYVTKPFGMDELLARLRAAVRRSEPVPGGEDEVVVDTAEFTVDLAAKKVNRDGRDVPPDTDRVAPAGGAGAQHGAPGQPEAAAAGGVGAVVRDGRTNDPRVYMAQLRRKLEADPAHPRHFITEPGMGYRFE